MSDQDDNKEKHLEQVVQDIMFQVVSVLNSYGITDVKAGNLMRLLGTPEEDCTQFDDKVMFIQGEHLEMRDVIPGEDQLQIMADTSKKLH